MQNNKNKYKQLFARLKANNRGDQAMAKAEKKPLVIKKIPPIEKLIEKEKIYSEAVKPISCKEIIAGEVVRENSHRAMMPLRKARFLRHYIQNGGQVFKACELIGIARTTFHSWLRRDPIFAEAVEEAKYKTLVVIEDEMIRRALEGADKPIIYKGEIKGYYKELSDELLKLRAKYLEPAYRDNYNNLIGISGQDMRITFIEPAAKPKQLLSAEE